jgi:hypothetical protein
MKRASELRQLAERYRRLKRQISDPQAMQAISEIANRFERNAAALEHRQRVRQRAHEIWIEQGCPEGRDIENWVAAESEVTSAQEATGEGQRQRSAITGAGSHPAADV